MCNSVAKPSKNRELAAMLTLLGVAAVVALVLATRTASISIVEPTSAETDDISEKPDVFASNSLPSDDRFMPSIGNGHIATNIFSDTVYMNGIYNGERGESKRARIPSYANIRLNSTLRFHHFTPNYTLDTKLGVFQVHVDREKTAVNHRVFAHRYFTRAIVNQIITTSKMHEPDFAHQVVWIDLKMNPGPPSDDIEFEEEQREVIKERDILWKCGKTKILEDVVYQSNPSEVCIFWTTVPNYLVVPRHGSRIHTFVMTVDSKKEVARREMEKVLQEDGDEIYNIHTREWIRLHQQCKINIEGNLKVAKIVHGIWYYFLSSLPSENSSQPLNPFYGLSPGSLARGEAVDYAGHSIWDTETWMFPPILLFYPNLAEKLLQYRINKVAPATELAKQTGFRGVRYPWESASTGREVTQPCCPEVAEYEQHITGCIAFAMRQYLAMTRDQKFLKNGGCSVVTDIAEFWASRAKLNYNTGYYDIANVMGPDEDHINVTNSVFTNVVAGYSLYLAQYVACLCKSFYKTENPDNWADIAWSLALPYDKNEDYHPEYQGYMKPEKIKQADAVLLGFPLQYPMKISTRKNDLSYYASVTRPSGPAMTWSMHTIGHLQLHDNLSAAQLFNKSFFNYVREPFKIWSELRRPNIGAVNFLTGMGGFLQTLLFGYAGISINLDKLIIRKPQLPPEATRFEIRGIKYLGSNITLDIHLKKTIFVVNRMDPAWPLMMSINNYNITLTPGEKVILSGSGPFEVKPIRADSCPMPDDIIGHNYLRPIQSHKNRRIRRQKEKPSNL